MQPVIGITTYQEKSAGDLPIVMIFQAYIQAIVQAGGVPVLIPSVLAEGGWDVLYERLDGILLSGGGDITLEHFEGDEHPRIEKVVVERHSKVRRAQLYFMRERTGKSARLKQKFD